MLSKEEIKNNRIPRQLAKALGIEKEDTDSLIAFKESLYEQTVKENIKLKKQVEQLESDKQKLIENIKSFLEEQVERSNKYMHQIIYGESLERIIIFSSQDLKEFLGILKGEKDEFKRN